MNSIGNVAYNIATFTGTAIKNSTYGVLVKWWEAGPFTKCAYKVYSLQGFEKLTKALGANLELMGSLFKTAKKSIDDQKNVVYASLIIDSVSQFVIEDERTHKVRIGWPKGGIIPTLYAIGSVFELGKYLQKYEVLKFERCTEWANQLASFEIYGYKPGTWPVLENLTHTPKAFFVFCASVLEVKSWLVPALYDLIGKVHDPRNPRRNTLERQRADILSPESMLKLISSTGKMVLTSCGTFYGSKTWFTVANWVTQHASLVGFLIKKPELR